MNELLLVTENRSGLCETNFVSTFAEFACIYMGNEDRDTVNRFEFLVDRTAGKTDVWSTYYQGGNVILDVRACAGKDDLNDFLAGKFNDSREKIEARLPGCSCAQNWHWKNDVEQFSPKALDIIRRESPESLRYAGGKQVDRKDPLDAVISRAVAKQQKSSQQTFPERMSDRQK